MNGNHDHSDQLSRGVLRRATGVVVAWLSAVVRGDGQISLPAKREERDWGAIRQAIFMQGLGPYLYETTHLLTLWEQVPEDIQRWMEGEHSRNSLRVERMFAELAALLREARRFGVEVMALKGILLAKNSYPAPGLRPMADLDLLVRPGDRRMIAEILETNGYTHIPSKSIYPNHDEYLNPDGGIVRYWDREHPDNPRPVEVHEVVRRPLWGDIGVVDLTDKLWAGRCEDEILGERIWTPDRPALLLHLAVHAMQHFMIGTGRAIMWLDLGLLSPEEDELEGLPYPNLVYPVARLAQRALPELFAGLDLSGLAQGVHPVLRRWCESTALDDRCGLTINNRQVKNRLQLMNARWNIRPWRIAAGYGNIPRGKALLQHASAFLRHIPHRVR